MAIAFVMFSLCWGTLFCVVELCQTPSAAVQGETLLKHDDLCLMTVGNILYSNSKGHHISMDAEII